MDHSGRNEHRALGGRRSQCVFVALVSFVVVSFVAPTIAHADLVFFESGRSLSVKAVSLDDRGSLVLALREGGEIVCDASLIARIAPDEIPYPEPEPAVVAGALGAPAAYDALIERTAAAEGVDARLVKAVIQ